MIQLHLTQEVVKGITKEEIRKLGKLENQEISSNNFYYRPLEGGELNFYKYKTTSAEERVDFLVIYKDKQYQWLLAEAYEEFEDFLENIYAHIGFKDNNLWKCNDFGNTTINDLQSKDYVWFQEQSKQQKIKYILNRLKDVFPEIKKIDQNNAMNVNLKLAIALIEQLRHVIVHKNGVVNVKEEFIKTVLEKAGLYNNGKPKLDNRDFIEKYFGGGKDENHIRLLDFPQGNGFTTVNVFQTLTNYLLSYSFFITETIKNEIDN